MDCTTHIEADFYTSKVQLARVELCCHCAGEFESPVEINTSLRAPEGPYSVVLPICQACLLDGCHIIVRQARQNARAQQAMLEAAASREGTRQDKVVDEAPAIVDEASAAACAQPKSRRNKRNVAM